MPSALASDSEWRIKSIKENYAVDVPFLMPIGTEIEFKNDHIAITDVIEFKYLDIIESASGNSFLIYTGRTCTECDMRTSIYIHAVSDKFYGITRYGLPGELYSYEDNTLLQKSRMFYGECLKEGEQTIIWYSNYLGTDDQWHKTVYDVDFDGIKVIKNPNNIPYDHLSKTEALVLKGKCRELQGSTTTTEP